jgi:hypothetical protein
MTGRCTTKSLLVVFGLAATAFGQQAMNRAPEATDGGAAPPPLKVALSGKALDKYTQARKNALEYLASPRCATFLSSHGFQPDQVANALTEQQPQDGTASSISFGAAGIIGSQPDPHSGDSVQTAFNNPNFLTMALSQPRGTDTYYNPQLLTRKIAYPYSNPVSVVHEALHNLTGESDVAIAQDFGYTGFEPLESNIFLNETLKKYCDSKP